MKSIQLRIADLASLPRMHDGRSEALPGIGPTEVLIRVDSPTARGTSARFIQRFLSLLVAGIADDVVGEIVTTGSAVTGLSKGDRVVLPATVRCSRTNTDRSSCVLRVADADRNLMKIPADLHDLSDERILAIHRLRLEWLDEAAS
ncbi:hypothetical protein AKJ09_06406 [Labilithrix luteola]|uniref:Alcohol dehydrogenase-like N-terminal domain-containing protein n=1 Tax=Labilithrix luteola TaxID=1391654 RepID=A0A0K1Q1Z6_9BACT|nr:alcohol dehydrogenase catalytic domain-containing protein [Labilithrix luteola]AKU99742.1 hypothetical protein AKJ09_06406 [Labilithrix luteola]